MRTLRHSTACIASALVLASAGRAQITLWEHTLAGLQRHPYVIVVDDGGSSVFSSTRHTGPFLPLSRSLTRLTFDGASPWTYEGPPGTSYAIGYVPYLDPQGDVLAFDRVVGSSIQFQKHSGIDGSLLWSRTLAQPAATSASPPKVVFGDNGELWFLVHYHVSGQNRSTVIKLDAAGNQLWSTFAAAWTTPQASFSTFERDGQGNVYYEEYFGPDHFRLAQVDAAGNVTWTYRYLDARGPNDGLRGLSADANGVLHWYVTLSDVVQPPATVEVRVDTSGVFLGAQDVAGYVRGGGSAERSGRVVHCWRDPLTGNYVTAVRSAAGVELWRAEFPNVAPDWSGTPAPTLDSNGGVLLSVHWQYNVPPPPVVPPYDESKRYDASGHLLWSSTTAVSGTPVGPDASVLYATVGSSQPLHVRKSGLVVGAFCFGDDVQTPCPCNNGSPLAAAAGCRNSSGHGAAAIGSGTPSLTADALALDVSNATGNVLLFFQGATFEADGRGTPFGDGLLCVGAPLVRIATRPLGAGALHYPQSGDPSLSVRGGVLTPGTRTYQGIYRNAASFCTASTLNTTNGVVVHWQP